MHKNSRLTYIGSFPPPVGGVTVKNALLYKYLCQHVDVNCLNLSRNNRTKPRTVVSLLRCLTSRKGNLIIALSTPWRYRITNFLYRFNPKKLQRSSAIIMGGTVTEDGDYLKRLGCYKHIYVETNGMKKILRSYGLDNVSIYPNCRERPSLDHCCESHSVSFRTLYFSLISRDKGVDIVLQTASLLPEVKFDLYGRIDEKCEDLVEWAKELPNVEYKGVFDPLKGDLVSLMQDYDLHLFPTRWPNEGVPGVLVETKIAGIPSVVSNINYNNEIITDGVDGIVLKENNSKSLVEAIRLVSSDKEILKHMKLESKLSAEKYYIDNYIDGIVEDLK